MWFKSNGPPRCGSSCWPPAGAFRRLPLSPVQVDCTILHCRPRERHSLGSSRRRPPGAFRRPTLSSAWVDCTILHLHHTDAWFLLLPSSLRHPSPTVPPYKGGETGGTVWGNCSTLHGTHLERLVQSSRSDCSTATSAHRSVPGKSGTPWNACPEHLERDPLFRPCVPGESGTAHVSRLAHAQNPRRPVANARAAGGMT